jgi:hypothetical protein
MMDTYVPHVMQDGPNPLDYDQRALYCAVMEQAVEDLRGCADPVDKDSLHHKRLRHEEAKRWFESESTCANSFLGICDLLGFDPARIRNHLFAEKKNTVGNSVIPAKPGIQSLVNMEVPMIDNCKCGCGKPGKVQGLALACYSRWRDGNEAMEKLMGGPFQKVRGIVRHDLKKKPSRPSDSSTGALAEADSSIAPGSQVIAKIKAKAAAANNGDLQKAVDLLIAQGFLPEELLQAARVMVRYGS